MTTAGGKISEDKKNKTIDGRTRRRQKRWRNPTKWKLYRARKARIPCYNLLSTSMNAGRVKLCKKNECYGSLNGRETVATRSRTTIFLHKMLWRPWRPRWLRVPKRQLLRCLRGGYQSQGRLRKLRRTRRRPRRLWHPRLISRAPLGRPIASTAGTDLRWAQFGLV